MKLKRIVESKEYTDLESLEKDIVLMIAETMDPINELEFDLELSIEEFEKFQRDVKAYMMYAKTVDIDNMGAKYTTMTFHGAKVNIYANR